MEKGSPVQVTAAASNIINSNNHHHTPQHTVPKKRERSSVTNDDLNHISRLLLLRPAPQSIAFKSETFLYYVHQKVREW